MLSIPARILVGSSILIVLTAVASNAGWSGVPAFDLFRSASASAETAIYPNAPVNTLVVTKVDDTNDGICDTDCSLREAVAVANASSGDDIINFDPTVFGSAQAILLSAGSLDITGSGMT